MTTTPDIPAATGFTPDWQTLAAASDSTTPGPKDYVARRAMLRTAAKVILRTTLSATDGEVAQLFSSSPLVGSGSDQHDIAPTISALVDNLTFPALLDLCLAPDAAWLRIQAALLAPSTIAALKPGTKTGYAFGQHRSISMSKMLAVIAANAPTATPKGTDAMDTVTDTASQPAAATSQPVTATAGASPATNGGSPGRGWRAVAVPDHMTLRDLIDAVELLLCPAYNALSDGQTPPAWAVIDRAVAGVQKSAADIIPDAILEDFRTMTEQDGATRQAFATIVAVYQKEPRTFAETIANATQSGSYTTRSIDLVKAITTANPHMLRANPHASPAMAGDDDPLEDATVAEDVPAWQPPIIDPSFAAALDGLLRSATSKDAGGPLGFDDLMKRAVEGEARAHRLATEQKRLADALSRSQMAGHTVTTTPASSDGTRPSGTIVYKRAWELFAPAGVIAKIKAGTNKVPPALDFDFPTFDYAGASHPDVDPIDDDYIFDPETLVPVLWALLNNRPMYLQGHTGAGKSTLIKQISSRTGWPCIRINLDSEITRLDLVGRDTLTNEGGVTVSKFADGIITQALQAPCIMLLDEVDFGRSDVMYVIQSVLEHDGLRVTEDGGRWVRPHPMFRIAATANTKGQGDEYGCYQGARVQSAALLDRFQVWVQIPYLSPKSEQRLVEAKSPGIPPSRADQLVKLANAIRKAFTSGEVLTTVSPRGLTTAAALFMHMKPNARSEVDAMHQALAFTVAGKASDTDREKIKELVVAHVA